MLINTRTRLAVVAGVVALVGAVPGIAVAQTSPPTVGHLLVSLDGTATVASTQTVNVPVSAQTCAAIQAATPGAPCDAQVVVTTTAEEPASAPAGQPDAAAGWHWTKRYAQVKTCSPFPTYCHGWHIVLAEEANEGEYGYGPWPDSAGRVCNVWINTADILALGVGISETHGIIDNCRSPMNPWENATVSAFVRGFPLSDNYQLRLYMYANGRVVRKVYNSGV